jgi:hypothetical protein
MAMTTIRPLILTFWFFILSFDINGQQIYPTRDSVHIFWQPDLKITLNDYKGDSTKEVMAILRKYDFSASASVGIWTVLDIPKKKNERGKKLEKAYFAPAFERTTSFTLTNDTLEIVKQNLYFDICEIWARWARKELQSIQDTMKSYGSISIMYTTIKKEMNDKKVEMYRSYFKDVFINKKEGSFQLWRDEVHKTLNNSTEWATKPEECYRLMSKKPIDDSYIMAPTLIGPLPNSK